MKFNDKLSKERKKILLEQRDNSFITIGQCATQIRHYQISIENEVKRLGEINKELWVLDDIE